MRQIILTRLLGGFLLVAAFGMVACGGASQSPTGGTNAGTPKAIGTTQANAMATSTLVTPGQVRLLLNKSRYAANEVITVTITNGLSTSIYAAANFTDCTPVLLEWKTPTGWVPRGRCLSAQLTGLVELKPGSATMQQLTPAGSVFKASSNAAWQAGIYRVTFIYGLRPDEAGTQGTIVQSGNFSIG